VRRPTPVVWNLLIINILVYLFLLVIEGTDYEYLYQYFVLFKSDLIWPRPAGLDMFHPVQIVTSFFSHLEFFHLLMNMLALYMLGTAVEYVMGSKRFVEFYLFCGVFSGAAIALLDPSYQPVLGASGALFGVLLAFAFYMPNSQMILFPIPIPIKAWMLVLGLSALSLFMVIFSPNAGGISHFGHLAGIVGGVLWMLLRGKISLGGYR